jgi:5-methylcytosine-specific restriction endonuclease McrA
MRIRSAAWRKKNPDRVRELSRADYLAKKEHYAALNKKWKQENPDRRLENNRRWALANPEKVAESRKKWKRENPEKAKAQQLAMTHLRRARKSNVGGKHTRQEIAELKRRQQYKCACCQESIKKNSHVDHIMPIALGGSNDISNIQILCPDCNVRKGKKDPIDWAQENGRLL